jgi:hypothetical protein
MHMSESLPENKTGRLRSVRGVHLPTVPREPHFHANFSFFSLQSKGPFLNTYTV